VVGVYARVLRPEAGQVESPAAPYSLAGGIHAMREPSGALGSKDLGAGSPYAPRGFAVDCPTYGLLVASASAATNAKGPPRRALKL